MEALKKILVVVAIGLLIALIGIALVMKLGGSISSAVSPKIRVV